VVRLPTEDPGDVGGFVVGETEGSVHCGIHAVTVPAPEITEMHRLGVAKWMP